MKKALLIILAIVATVSVVFGSMRLDIKTSGGMISVTLNSKVSAQEITLSLDEYTDSEMTKISDTQYEIYYEGTGSKIEIGSVDKEIIDFKPDITVTHWNDEVSFSLIAPAAIDSKSKLTADMWSDFVTDKVIASNNEWNFEYYAVQPNQSFNEYGGIDIIITAKQKPSSNKIYFTYDSRTVTPYYQGELTPEEIAEGASRPDEVVGSIAFYANDKANHAIGGINYATGKVGHLYAMRAGNEWCRWSIEGDFIVLTIPYKVYNGVYPVVISPVGDTFGYTTAGGSNFYASSNYLFGQVGTPSSDGTVDSVSIYGSSYSFDNGKGIIVLESSLNIVANGVGDGTVMDAGPSWMVLTYTTNPSVTGSINYCASYITDGAGNLYYDSGSGTQGLSDTSNSYATPTNPTDGTRSSSRFSIYATYTPSGGGDPEIGVSPVEYDFGVVAESTTPYTATDYFTITNNSTMQTDQTISVTSATWTGGNAFTHSDTCTPGSDTVGLSSNRGGTWGVGDVIVKYSSPNYIYENCPATTDYDFGIKLYMATSASDAVEKTNTVRITATAD